MSDVLQTTTSCACMYHGLHRHVPVLTLTQVKGACGSADSRGPRGVGVSEVYVRLDTLISWVFTQLPVVSCYLWPVQEHAMDSKNTNMACTDPHTLKRLSPDVCLRAMET